MFLFLFPTPVFWDVIMMFCAFQWIYFYQLCSYFYPRPIWQAFLICKFWAFSSKTFSWFCRWFTFLVYVSPTPPTPALFPLSKNLIWIVDLLDGFFSFLNFSYPSLCLFALFSGRFSQIYLPTLHRHFIWYNFNLQEFFFLSECSFFLASCLMIAMLSCWRY